MAIPRRGLQELRTLSGKVDQPSLPYRGYMKITCLEMEKARRALERRSAAARIADIDARLKEIEAEKAALVQLLEGRTPGRPTGVRGLEVKSGAVGRGGFRFRY